MTRGAPWTTRRKLFVAEALVFTALMIAGIVFEVTGHGLSHALTGALVLLVVIAIHTTLRLTYFKGVLPEMRKQRETRSD